jgi:hypothetical protein
LFYKKKNCIFANWITETYKKIKMDKIKQNLMQSARTKIGGEHTDKVLIINTLPPPPQLLDNQAVTIF